MIEVVLWFAFVWLVCGVAAIWIADSHAWTTGQRFNWSLRSWMTMILLVTCGPLALYGTLKTIRRKKKYG